MLYHVVLRRKYQDVSGFVVDMESRATHLLCCEHIPDKEESTTHCHVVIETEISQEAIRKRINLFNVGGRGQYAIMTKTMKTRVPYIRIELLRYVLKGQGRAEPQESFLTRQFGYVDDEVRDAIMSWNLNAKAVIDDDDNKGKTHYDLIKEIYAKANKTTRIVRDEFGNLINEHCVDNTVATWHLMCKELNANKVRTSKHELNRFYTTLLRQDPLHQEDLYAQYMREYYR